MNKGILVQAVNLLDICHYHTMKRITFLLLLKHVYGLHNMDCLCVSTVHSQRLFLTDRYFQNLIIIINNVDKKNHNSNTAI